MSANQTTRQTLKDFLSARGNTADTISLSPNPQDTSPAGSVNEGDDLGIDPNTGLPLIGLQGLASAYVAYLTQQTRNEFKLAPAGEVAASSDRGSPIENADSQGAERVFVRAGTSLGQTMSTISNSGQFDQGRLKLSDYLDKTGASQDKSGNSLLSDVVGQPLDVSGRVTPNQVLPDTSTQAGKMLITSTENISQNNRFTSGNPTLDGESGVAVDDRKIQSAQRAFGDYLSKDNKTDTLSYSYEQLKDVGNWLLASAAGYEVENIQSGKTDVIYVNISSNDKTQNIRNLEGQLSDLEGSTLENLRASNANGYPRTISGESFRADRGDIQPQQDVDARYSKSAIRQYTPDAQAANFTDIKSLNLAQARACYAVIKLSSLLGDTYRQFVRGVDKVESLKSLGPYYMGGSIYSRVNSLCRMQMNVFLVPTKNKYDDAVRAGMFMMLGREPTNSDNESQVNFGLVSYSPTFWNSVAESAVKLIREKDEPVNNPAAMGLYYAELGRSPAIRAMNAFATVGDIALQVSGKTFNSDTFSQDIQSAQGIDIIDELPTTAGTRISKSREGSGRSPLALSWRGNSVPGLYMLPDDTIKAALTMGNSLTGENPARGMLASSLVDKTYVDPALKGEKARIPGDIVKIIEDKLDAEYVPFYFHDLRTNEIISFHAFLENLSETFAAQYNSYKSYGRTDAVKTYGSTNRTISFSFTVASTSRDDFDEMWFKLNRLIASTYPKYTPGQQVKTGDVTFQQPFSQVVGATPLMRLRVGDVIKSNYSRFNLARFFGIGSDGTDVSAFDASKKNSSNAGATQNQQQESVKSGYDKWKVGAFYTIFGSPLKTLESTQSKDALSSQISTNIASNVLVNGFVNPVGYALMTNFSRSPDTNYASNLDANLGVQQSIAGYRTIAGGIVYIKPRERPYDVVDSSGNNIIGKAKIRRQVRAIVLGRNEIQSNINESDPSYQSSYKIDNNSLPRKETQYRVRIIDFGTLIPASRQLDGITEGDSLLGEYLLVTHDELLPDLSTIFSSAAVFTSPIASTADALLAAADSLASALNLNVSSIVDNAAKKGVEGFMSPNNNGIVRAFENNRGRGLAGVITNLQFNWLEFPWETDWGARAPMGAKVTISFECMHDLPPGLDASGYMRAPTHNVGSVMNTIAGDPYDDKGDVSRTNFTNNGASNIVKKA